LETDAKTNEDNSQSERYEHGPPSAADENRSDTDIQREQTASDLNPLDVDLDSSLDAVKNELKDTERIVARQGSDLTKDSLVSADVDSLVGVVSNEFGKGEYASANRGALEAGTKHDPRKQMENILGIVLLELEKRLP
jgi:hypothetical protein